jgi:hypothetical protein
MSAERGWIGEPQPTREWHRSRYSYEADKRCRHLPVQKRAAEAQARREALLEADSRPAVRPSLGPPLRIADRYGGGAR